MHKLEHIGCHCTTFNWLLKFRIKNDIVCSKTCCWKVVTNCYFFCYKCLPIFSSVCLTVAMLFTFVYFCINTFNISYFVNKIIGIFYLRWYFSDNGLKMIFYISRILNVFHSIYSELELLNKGHSIEIITDRHGLPFLNFFVLYKTNFSVQCY